MAKNSKAYRFGSWLRTKAQQAAEQAKKASKAGYQAGKDFCEGLSQSDDQPQVDPKEDKGSN